MPRIIDGEKNNIVGQQVRYFRKKRKFSQTELSIRLETLAIYVCRGSGGLLRRTGQRGGASKEPEIAQRG